MGVMVVMNLMIGLVTPPYGLCLMIACSVAGVRMVDTLKDTFIMLLPMLGACFMAMLVPTLLGNSLFPADNPWNQQITSAPVASNSAAVINNIISHQGSDGRLHPDFGPSYGEQPVPYGIPITYVYGTHAKVPVTFFHLSIRDSLSEHSMTRPWSMMAT